MLRLLVLASSLSIMTGCATVLSGSTQTLTFNSSPPGAQVSIDGLPRGVTPLTVEVRRKAHGAIEITKEGYKAQHMQLGKKLNPIFFGNILAGGSFGSSTDASTGAMREYSQDAYYATLEADHIATPADAIADKNNALRDFVLVNFESLRREASGNGGEYIKALNRLSYGRNESVYSSRDLQQIFATCDGPVSCAETIAGDRAPDKVASVKAEPVKTASPAEKPARRRR